MPVASHKCPGCQRVGMWKGTHCRTCKQLERMERDPITTPPSNPSWRPRHWPPACEDCNGFGYAPHTWSKCRTCRQHPGHAMTHEEWSSTRA